MNKLLKISILGAMIFIVGCAGPRYTGSSIPQNIITENPDVLSINDTETRDGFQSAVELWLKDNNKNYVVKPEGSQHDPEKLTIEYVGHWKWDMALYLSQSDIEAFYKGQRVSKVSFKAPNSLNTNKWGDAEERIGLMLDIMFGKKSVKEATNEL